MTRAVYVRGDTLGRGQWGIVYRATRESDAQQVAIKRVRCTSDGSEGINFQVLREIKMLRDVAHPNVTRLFDVFHDAPEEDGAITISLVFELMATDLERVIYERRDRVSLGEAKGYATMMLDGLAFLHSRFVLHRDIKPANLLISARGELKLADFGYARCVAEQNCHMSYECCTLWYRPPELLFGAQEYGAAVDVWSAGCVLAELVLRRPIFRGESEIDQLSRILQVVGTQTDASWPGVEALRKFVRFTDVPGAGVAALLADASSTDFANLVAQLLAPDPNARATATHALTAPYFASSPPPLLRAPPPSKPAPG